MGRTGMRGKGALWRWGPNHVIKAVVTRWRKQPSPELIPVQSYVMMEGKRVLEFISLVITVEFWENLTEASSILPGVRLTVFESHHKKNYPWAFRPVPTQIGLYSHRRWLEAWNFRFWKKRYCTIY